MRKRFRNWFYSKGIVARTTLAVMAIIVFSVAIIVIGSVVIFRGIFIGQTRNNSNRDCKLVSEKVDMFISLVQSDSIYLGTCEWCQEILKTYPSFDLTTVDVEYQIYKAMQNVAYQSIYQKENYHRVILYDTNQNEFVYGDNRFSAENQKYHMALVDEFLSGNQREAYLPIHQSPWNDFRTNAFPECISYIKKVYDYDSGKLIGAIEFEIDCDTLGELYQTVLSDRNAFLLLAEDGTVISSSDEEIAVHTALNAQWLDEASAAGQLYTGGSIQKNGKLYLFAVPTTENFIIVNIVPQSVYLKNMSSYFWIIMFIALVAMSVGLYLSKVLIRSITKPLNIITDAAVEIGNGNFNKRVHVLDGGELGILANQFNSMVDRIQRLMEHIVETERKKRETELSLVQMRMTPHFFYNVLESICGLIVIEDKKQAIKTIHLLSNFYRGILSKGREIVSLSKELSIADYYIQIMQICYPGKFTYEVDCPEELKENQINKLTLQPILENAIHHGFAQMETGGKILTHIYRQDGDMLIDISDNGCGIGETLDEIFSVEDERFHMESFGLRNTDERIRLFFGQRYGIRIAAIEHCTTIRVRLPDQSSNSSTNPLADVVPENHS